MKLEEKELSQRFFLDAGIGFWEELSADEAILDYEDSTKINFLSKHKLCKPIVAKIECDGTQDRLSTIVFDLNEIKLILKYVDGQDIDSETVYCWL